MATIRENEFLNDQKTLSDGERVLRRLRDPSHCVEVLNPTAQLDVAHFVFDMNISVPTSTREYHCSTCGAHAILYFIKVEGAVSCRCGKIEGKPL